MEGWGCGRRRWVTFVTVGCVILRECVWLSADGTLERCDGAAWRHGAFYKKVLLLLSGMLSLVHGIPGPLM
jgi:hypothetical protein